MNDFETVKRNLRGDRSPASMRPAPRFSRIRPAAATPTLPLARAVGCAGAGAETGTRARAYRMPRSLAIRS